jgi:hypothetical protein
MLRAARKQAAHDLPSILAALIAPDSLARIANWPPQVTYAYLC